MNMRPRTRGILIAGAVLAALFSEWMIARSAGGRVFVPPMTALAVIVAVRLLPFSGGLWVALAAGFLLDSVGLPPFGATILAFVFMVCAIKAVQWVIADPASYRAKFALVAGWYLCVAAVMPLARIGAALLKL